MKRLLTLLAAVLALTLSAHANTLAPCSPNCQLTDPFYEYTISFPSTALDTWPGPSEERPLGIFSFGLYSTPALDDLTIANAFEPAYANSSGDSELRHGRNDAALMWAYFQNGVPGWSKDEHGVLAFSDPPPLDSSENPEPSTWLLMATGVAGLIFVARRHRLSTMMSSQ